MEKISKNRQRLPITISKTTTEQINKTETATPTAIKAITEKLITKSRLTTRAILRNQKKINKTVALTKANHETSYRRVQQPNCNTEKGECNADNSTNEVATITNQKPTAAKAQNFHRISNNNSNLNINYSNNNTSNSSESNNKNNHNDKYSYNFAYKLSNACNNQTQDTTQTPQRLLPYLASTAGNSQPNIYDHCHYRHYRHCRREQLTPTTKRTTNRTQRERYLNCDTSDSITSMMLYDESNESNESSHSKTENPKDCYTNRTLGSIKTKQRQGRQPNSKIEKLLQYIRTLSNLKSNYGSKNCYNFDVRSFFYITIFILFYCTVLIHASATATATTNASASATVQATSTATAKATTRATETKTATATATAIASKSATFELQQITANISNKIKFNEDSRQYTVESRDPNQSDPNASMVYFNANYKNSTHRRDRRDAANVPDDDDDSSYHDDEFDEYDALIRNKSAKGKYIGAPCDGTKCEATLLHVTCDKETMTCGCEKNYPVQLGLTKGCDKPKKLGEQCFYDETCMYNDENSLCVQVRHNALCQCASGFHSVSYTKPTRRIFCTQDLKELTSDLPTLLGVTTGIAVLAGLICMVLHLFSKTKYPRHRNFGDANIPPPIMYSSDTGLPLIVQSGRPSSRSSLRSSGSIGSYGNRRSSSGGVLGGGMGIVGGGGGSGSSGSKGILVSTSRTGSRRPSLASVHSTSSSVRSYSMMRFEKETQQKEIRQEMKLRLARLQHQQQMSQNRPQIIIGDALTMLSGRLDHNTAASGSGSGSGTAITAFTRLNMATPSPLTPNSTDELLPAVDELQEYPMTSTKIKAPMTLTTTGGQEIATTSTMALAAATTSSSLRTKDTEEKSSEGNITSGLADAAASTQNDGAYIGPCSSSSEAL